MLFLLLACTTSSDSTDTKGGGDSGVDAAVCTEPTEVTCQDELVSDLSLQDDKTSDGDVTTTTDGADFLTSLDASAGGYGNETTHAWTYMKFTASGAQKVELTDEEALTSMDWDLAARRFIIRLNGGSSGPSCVGAAVMGQGYTYEDLASVPDGISYATDDFYTDDCGFVNDSSGLEGSPQVVLSPWWEYPGCVATTGQPFLIQLADGTVVKFRVESYYDEGQEDCNNTGMATGSGGYYVFRWAYMP